jgi:phospholipid/cholesterol/gamma-HCH transport system permease protein
MAQSLAQDSEVRIEMRADATGEHAYLVPTGHFDLAHAMGVERAIGMAEQRLDGCQSVDVDLGGLERIDGSGAVLLAGLLDRLEAKGRRTRVTQGRGPEAGRLIALYRTRRSVAAAEVRRGGVLARLGAIAAQLPATINHGLDFTGAFAVSLVKAAGRPQSVDWRSLPGLVQQIGADAFPVTGAANLLVGLIIGFLGVSQLGRFGAVVYVPELVVVAHFRELGPLVTAIVVAGRSGAGLASEIATMKVSEEIDALRAMGFDPVRWLVVPRCLALAIMLPLLTWVGDVLALIGGLVATTSVTNMTVRAYVIATNDAITGAHLTEGLLKTPVLALVIGLIACGQGLATQGGAAAVGARTTTAVVLALFGVLATDAVFTFLYAFIGM